MNALNELLVKIIVAVHSRVADFRDEDRGATATEYAMLVAFIAVAIVVAVTAFGSALSTFFNGLGDKIGLNKIS